MEKIVLTRKAQITEVAKNMFRQQGYAATSMRDLAREIGIEPASLYSHIRSKEELLSNICFKIGADFFEAFHEIETITDPAARLTAAIKGHVAVIVNNLDASAVFLHEWRFLSEPNLSEFKSQRDRYESYFRALIREGIEGGIFKKQDEKFIVLTIFSSLNWIYEWYKPEGSMCAEDIGQKLSELILEGLKTQHINVNKN